MDNKYFYDTCKKKNKQTNKQITRTKTAKQLRRIMKLISETVQLFLDPYILILCIILRLINQLLDIHAY